MESEEGEEENWDQADVQETIKRDMVEEGTLCLPPSHLSQRCVEEEEGGCCGEEGTSQGPTKLGPKPKACESPSAHAPCIFSMRPTGVAATSLRESLE